MRNIPPARVSPLTICSQYCLKVDVPDCPVHHRDRSKLARVFPKIDRLYRDYAEQHQLPGLAYGIVCDGSLIFAGGVGIQNVETQTPVSPDSVFRIASMSKSFTAMALLKLRDAGKLYLDEAVATYVPELGDLVYPTRDSAPITVRNC